MQRLGEIVLASVRESIRCSSAQKQTLVEEIVQSLKDWYASGAPGFHCKHSLGADTVAFIIVQDFCRLTHLFVLPEYQGRGIGRSLVHAAVEACRTKSPQGVMQLNASTNACAFYEAMGFRQAGPAVERPGGCIPYTYEL